MHLIGKLKNIAVDFLNNSILLTVGLDNANEINRITAEYEEVMEHDKCAIDIKKYRKKRSLDSNAYFWVLCQKLAEILHKDKWEVYLDLLSKYGVFTHVIVKPNVVDRVKEEWRTVRELGEVTVNGQTGIQLQCYFGSSTYNSKEMSVLIEGTVSECRDLGIETLSDEEIQSMKESWGK